MCNSCGKNKLFGNLIPVTGGNVAQKNVRVTAGPGILVENLSDANEFHHRVSRIEVEALTVSLTLVAKAATIVKSNPILKGTVVDEVNLTWVYNKVIADQILSNTGGLTAPTLDDDDVAHNYTAQTINAEISFTIEGNDGLGQPGSIASDTKSITFGNWMFLGAGLSRLGTAASSLEAFIEAFSKVMKTSRVHTYFATGGVNQKHFVAYPKSFGLGTFTKPPFVGGYIRLKNVEGVLKSELEVGEVETDIEFTNEEGFAEAYYIYESLIDNQNDPVTAFTIS